MEGNMKYIVGVALAALFFTCHAEDRWLTYQLNEATFVRIANVDCPLPELKTKYPWGAIAYNSKRKEYLFGCFNHKGDDIIIQWGGGDKSIFPANMFLVQQ